MGRVVQIGPAPPDAAKQYAPPLSYTDALGAEVMAKMGQMMKEPPSGDPEEVCKKFWAVLRELYVADPKDADRVDWGRCDLENERNFMRYFMGQIMPSIRSLKLTAGGNGEGTAPVLVVHGTQRPKRALMAEEGIGRQDCLMRDC